MGGTVQLADPLHLLLGLLFVPLLLARARPHLGYSSLRLFGDLPGVPLWPRLPGWAMGLGACLLLMALARPQWGQVVERERRVARDIILAVDLSGSMKLNLRSGGGLKIDLAKEAALRFVKPRKGDRVALFVFDEETYGSWPLSSDLGIIQEKIRALEPNLSGTDLAKPFEKALAHFQDSGQSSAKALILVTDGDAPIPAQLRQEIQRRLTAMGVHVYLVGIDLVGAVDILDLVGRSGGRVFEVSQVEDFSRAVEEISRLEPSAVVVEKRTRYRDLYPWFTLGGLAALSLAILGAALAPRVP